MAMMAKAIGDQVRADLGSSGEPKAPESGDGEDSMSYKLQNSAVCDERAPEAAGLKPGLYGLQSRPRPHGPCRPGLGRQFRRRLDGSSED